SSFFLRCFFLGGFLLGSALFLRCLFLCRFYCGSCFFLRCHGCGLLYLTFGTTSSTFNRCFGCLFRLLFGSYCSFFSFFFGFITKCSQFLMIFHNCSFNF